MKKFGAILVAFIACAACFIGLVACGKNGADNNADPVAGKTYVFEKAEITKGAAGAAKEMAEEYLEELFAKSSLAFGENGAYSMTILEISESGTYKQSGSKLKLSEDGQEAKVSGDTVILLYNQDGVEANIVYKLLKEEDPGTTPDPEEPVVEVAGKTYLFADIKLDMSVEVGDAEKAQIDELIAQARALYKGAKISFRDDGSYKMTVQGTPTTGTYTQNKADLTLTSEGGSTYFTVSGNEISFDMETYGFTYKYYYQLTENDDEKDDDNTGKDDDNNKEPEITYFLAGKTYIAESFYDSDNKPQEPGVYAGARIVFKQKGVCTMTINGSTATGVYTEYYSTSNDVPDEVIIYLQNAPDNMSRYETAHIDVIYDGNSIKWDDAPYQKPNDPYMLSFGKLYFSLQNR